MEWECLITCKVTWNGNVLLQAKLLGMGMSYYRQSYLEWECLITGKVTWNGNVAERNGCRDKEWFRPEKQSLIQLSEKQYEQHPTIII